jgi:MoaA/NifB/PqqE/SkfB family radical SAM enzyme
MLEQLQGLHIEPTNMCTLKCPRCSRTEFINQFPGKWKNQNLNLEHLKSFLDIDLRNKKIIICGNYGDAIYYNQLFDMVDYFKNAGAVVSISTNGSYKTAEWWKELSSRLDKKDKIIFAIDGVPENFTQYRINADWPSISDAINVLRHSEVKLSWQYILFSYNEGSVDAAKQLSLNMGFDEFFVIQSGKWDNGLETLAPELDQISQSKIQWKKQKNLIEVTPACKQSNDRHFISAQGYYSPCCWSAEHRFYYKSEFYKNKSQYDISKTTISEVLFNLNNFYNSLEENKFDYCTFNCPKI